MTVFQAAADESLSTPTGEFFYGGFIAPEREWDEFFTPAWEQYVLNASPSIKYLHVTDLKSARGRQKLGITEGEAEAKLDEAVRVIRGQGALFPITAHVNERYLQESLKAANVTMVIRTPGGLARKKLEPDYLCFLRFALHALHYVHEEHPDAKRVDFMLERKDQVTRNIETFHKSISKALTQIVSTVRSRLRLPRSMRSEQR